MEQNLFAAIQCEFTNVFVCHTEIYTETFCIIYL